MQIMRHLKQQGPSERLILRYHWKHCVYLASRNFLSLLGRSWFLRCLNHLWTCRTGKPVCLLKLSTEHWRQKQDKDKRVSEVCHLKWQTTADRGSQAMWMAGCVCVFFFLNSSAHFIHQQFWALWSGRLLCHFQGTRCVYVALLVS